VRGNGTGGAPADVDVVLGEPVADRLAHAVAAGVLVERDGRPAFPDGAAARAAYESVPAGLRPALHEHAARALAKAGAAPVTVAAQLRHAPRSMARWALDWLDDHAESLGRDAPAVAEELLERAVDEPADGDPRRYRIAGALTRLLFAQARYGEAQTYARLGLRSADPELAAEMRWLLVLALSRTGAVAEAADELRPALEETAGPPQWTVRFLALQAHFLCGAGDIGRAGQVARLALSISDSGDYVYGMGLAMLALAHVDAQREDDVGRLAWADHALELIGEDPGCADVRVGHLAERVYALRALDRAEEVEPTIAVLRAVAAQCREAEPIRLHHPLAVHYYLSGRWDEALAEVAEIPVTGPDDPYAVPVHGLQALVAAHRDQREVAARHLHVLRDERFATPYAIRGCLPLLAARALTAERDEGPAAARDVLAVLCDDRFAVMQRERLLPELVRHALAAHDLGTAERAVHSCEGDAARHPTAGRLAALGWGRGILHRDPAPVLAAAEYHAEADRAWDTAMAYEDAAVLQAERGDPDGARRSYAAAAERYERFGAEWDLRRAASRLRPYNIRRGIRGPRNRPRHGWDALTATERRVAELIATGCSNPEIAAQLLLSRSTVKAHVSKILAKLPARTRVEIAREAAGHRSA
jgi:DNA-binding CsgD family transcriptional regulator